MTPTWLDLQLRGDERGSLIAIEGEGTIPFKIERVYYLFGTKPGVERGFHAHRALTQLCIAVRGSCRMFFDDGKTKLDFQVDRPDHGVVIPPGVWHEMRDFSPDCVLMVLANAHYDESDYIRNYQDFLRHAHSSNC